MKNNIRRQDATPEADDKENQLRREVEKIEKQQKLLEANLQKHTAVIKEKSGELFVYFNLTRLKKKKKKLIPKVNVNLSKIKIFKSNIACFANKPKSAQNLWSDPTRHQVVTIYLQVRHSL